MITRQQRSQSQHDVCVCMYDYTRAQQRQHDALLLMLKQLWFCAATNGRRRARRIHVLNIYCSSSGNCYVRKCMCVCPRS